MSRPSNTWSHKRPEPTVQVTTPEGDEATRQYLLYYDKASRMHAGTLEIKSLMSFLINDPKFQEAAEDILKLNMQGPIWLDSFFKATAKRALKLKKQREDIEVKQVYDKNPNFGMF